MSKKHIQLQQINAKLLGFVAVQHVIVPPTGWIKAIRTAIGMSQQQLGKKLNVSKQAVMDIEKREKKGAITIKALREIARAMDMELVYGFTPKDGSLDALIEKRATELATQIVLRTANTMNLEDQANSKKRIEAAIKERALAIQNEMPKMLWD